MTHTTQQLLTQALELPMSERAELAERLMESISTDQEETEAMIADKTQLLAAARSLSVTDRRELIDALLCTLPEEAGTREAWVEECRQRLAAYDRGETTAVPLTDVFPELAS